MPLQFLYVVYGSQKTKVLRSNFDFIIMFKYIYRSVAFIHQNIVNYHDKSNDNNSLLKLIFIVNFCEAGMANILINSTINTHENEFFFENENMKYFDTQFSEKDVIELQEMFLTFGIHCIKIKDVQSGREIIKTILGSLNHFKNIGAITYASGLQDFVCDILVHIKMQEPHYFDDIFIDLEIFFTMHACFDFIWIEFTDNLLIRNFEGLKNIFEMYHVNNQMPVIFMMYENEIKL